jgi:hypothetical protein
MRFPSRRTRKGWLQYHMLVHLWALMTACCTCHKVAIGRAHVFRGSNLWRIAHATNWLSAVVACDVAPTCGALCRYVLAEGDIFDTLLGQLYLDKTGATAPPYDTDRNLQNLLWQVRIYSSLTAHLHWHVASMCACMRGRVAKVIRESGHCSQGCGVFPPNSDFCRNWSQLM